MSKPFVSIIDGKLHEPPEYKAGRVKKKTYFYELLDVGDKAETLYNRNMLVNISRYASQSNKVFKTKTRNGITTVWRVE